MKGGLDAGMVERPLTDCRFGGRQGLGDGRLARHVVEPDRPGLPRRRLQDGGKLESSSPAMGGEGREASPGVAEAPTTLKAMPCSCSCVQ